jgi:hypothetical protein
MIGSLERKQMEPISILIDQDLFKVAPADIWKIKVSRPGSRDAGFTERLQTLRGRKAMRARRPESVSAGPRRPVGGIGGLILRTLW